MKLKYCIICEQDGKEDPWTNAEFIMDDTCWRYECGHEASEEAQKIIDRNFGRLYDLEV